MKKWNFLLAAALLLSPASFPLPAFAATTADGSVTRLEAARAFAKTLGLDVTAPAAASFSDEPASAQDRGCLEAVKKAGLMNGDGNGRFRPDAPLSREELAVLLLRAADVHLRPQKALPVADADAVDAWAREAVGTALEVGLLHGDGTNFNPHQPLTPEHLQAALANLQLRNGITDAVQARMNAVNARDKTAFLSLLDPTQPEYQAEQEHWFDDILRNNIQNFSLVVNKVEADGPSAAVVTLWQAYQSGQELKTVSYAERYVFSQGADKAVWLDADLNFGTISTKHFDIKHLPADEATAKAIASQAEIANDNLQEKLPHDDMGKTTIKLYNDLELLRQSVKLSIAFNMSGWYEYPESIKLYTGDGEEGFYELTIEHESTHKVTLNWANNNMSYWFGEGLATYYSQPMGASLPLYPKARYAYLPIADLEKINLEALTNPQQIRQYYNNAGLLVQYLSETYGDDKLKAILLALGRYPHQDGTVAEHDAQNNQYLHAVIPNVLGVSMDALDRKWLNWIEGKQ